MKRTTLFLVTLCVIVAFSSCKKLSLDPLKQEVAGDALVGNWKLTQLTGTIDSVITINGTSTTTQMSFGFDSVSNQSVQKINGVVKYQYPYALTISLKNDGNNQLVERYTRANNAGVQTPYLFITNSSWNYASTNNPYDGVIIRGFEKTTVLGDTRITPATMQGSNYIQKLLSSPQYNSYDVRNGHFYLYIHMQYAGNADANGGGVVTNPGVKINVDYVLTFSKTSTVDTSGL